MTEVEAFKNELRNYRYYQSEVRRLEEEISLLIYSMEGVKGVNPSSEGGTTNPSAKSERLLDMIEKKERLEVRKRSIEAITLHVDSVLSNIEEDTRKCIIRIYVSGRTYRSTARHMDEATLYRHINEAIKKALY